MSSGCEINHVFAFGHEENLSAIASTFAELAVTLSKDEWSAIPDHHLVLRIAA